VIPVIRGANGTISKLLRQYLSNIPGKHEIKGLQKTATLGTAHMRCPHEKCITAQVCELILDARFIDL